MVFELTVRPSMGFMVAMAFWLLEETRLVIRAVNGHAIIIKVVFSLHGRHFLINITTRGALTSNAAT